MTRARALVAAVPHRVYTAVAGLVLLASLGVALVLGAGLSTWQGGVDHPSTQGGARQPGSVLIPPGSAVIVVPTPVTSHPAAPAGAAAARPGVVVHVSATVTAPATGPPPAPAPVVSPPAAPAGTPATTARPRVATSTASLPHTARGRAVGHVKHAKASPAGKAGTHGRHLGWAKTHGKGHAYGHDGQARHGL